jgi:hypothetical protein
MENVVLDNWESVYGGYDPASGWGNRTAFGTVIKGIDNGSVVVLAEGSTIEGLTITGGKRDYGAGVFIGAVTARVLGCEIRGNAATERGSAISVIGGHAEICDNVIVGNTNPAVHLSACTAVLRHNLIADTKAPKLPHDLKADGIYLEKRPQVSLNGDRVIGNAGRGVNSSFLCGGSLAANDCIFAENRAAGLALDLAADLSGCVIGRNNTDAIERPLTDGNGGGLKIHTQLEGRTILRHCIFVQNYNGYRGAAIRTGSYWQHALGISHCIFTANNSAWGECCNLTLDPLELTNNLFVGNGVVVVNEQSWGGLPLKSINNTFVGNQGAYRIERTWAGAVTMINDLLWGNGDDLKMSFLSGASVTQQAIRNCNIEDGDRNGADGNVSIDPDFVGLCGEGRIGRLSYDANFCRSVVWDVNAAYEPNSLRTCFLWTEGTPFPIISNSQTTLSVWGKVGAVAKEGSSYTVQDYRSLEGGLCIDGGTNDVPLTEDLEGTPRKLDGNGDGSVVCDIGVFEFVGRLSDSDADGMPDWWELRYGLNPNEAADANGDLDGDGVSNLSEWIAGTIPNKRESH